MALKATIFKADLQINDSDKNYYNRHSFTIAQHPSETDERMMIRIIAFAMFASDELKFTKGLSAEDEPELWRKNLTDEIELWIELGQPEERRVKKACGRSKHVVIFCYGRTGQPWWEKGRAKLSLIPNLSVIYLDIKDPETLKSMVGRTMDLQFSIDSGDIWLSDGKNNVEIKIEYWMKAD